MSSFIDLPMEVRDDIMEFLDFDSEGRAHLILLFGIN